MLSNLLRSKYRSIKSYPGKSQQKSEKKLEPITKKIKIIEAEIERLQQTLAVVEITLSDSSIYNEGNKNSFEGYSFTAG